MTSAGANVLVPKGLLNNSPAFQRREPINCHTSPEGTAESGVFFGRHFGTKRCHAIQKLRFTVKFAALFVLGFCTRSLVAQTTNVIDPFNPSGAGGHSYSAGQIGKVWTNWFGGAFQSLTWDSTSDGNTNPASGSMKITALFSAANNQFEATMAPTVSTLR